MRASLWGRFAVVLGARAVLAALIGLAFWAVVPLILGWHTTTVMTGSMEPSLHPGDVVVSKTVPPEELRKGQVLLFADPDHVGTLRLHRFDSLNSDGTLTTKGDANPAADSTHISRSTVTGVGYLRIPLIGTPILWVAEHRSVPLLTLGAGLVLLTGLAVLPAVSTPRAPTTPSGPHGRHRATPRRPRTASAVFAAAVAVTVALAVPAPAAAAAFSATAATPVSVIATAAATPATGLTCTTNTNGSVTIGWSYNGALPERFTTLIDGVASSDTSTGTARTTTISSSGLFSFRSSTITIRTDLTDTWTTASDSTVRITTVRFLGLGRTSCA
ncbi:signal peptidase I [Curtobacterium sp. VKM Ac-1376]|nr:signal peptidase I [Curtobacterium sp. VKM Ac-1376]